MGPTDLPAQLVQGPPWCMQRQCAECVTAVFVSPAGAGGIMLKWLFLS